MTIIQGNPVQAILVVWAILVLSYEMIPKLVDFVEALADWCIRHLRES